MIRTSVSFFIAVAVLICGTVKAEISPTAIKVAEHATQHYQAEQIETLRQLVSFPTVAKPNVAITDHQAMSDMKAFLKQEASRLGLDYTETDYMIVIGLGEQKSRVGIVTHGDVQPAESAKWAKSPFELDLETEPGKLIGRGTEDDKGPIATALYAMKSIKDLNITLKRRIELYVYLAEESDWEPFKAYMQTHEMPELNLTIDSSYPVVVAEKGWSQIKVTVPNMVTKSKAESYLTAFSGGRFSSQIPEQASVVVNDITDVLLTKIKQKAAALPAVNFDFIEQGNDIKIIATGRSAHSSEPKNGINAVAYLADLLSVHQWPPSTASATVAYINDLVGTGYDAEQFGDIAYSDDFMGPMTLAPTLVKKLDTGVEITLNLRRPIGKSAELLDKQTMSALTAWQNQSGVTLTSISTYWGEPLKVTGAKHVQPLLDTYSYFTGEKDPKPLSSGGSTNAKLIPNALSFGPSMPGVPYTGHSEHEYLTTEQFLLNLKMYSAMMVELGNL